jgi:alcohol dehydrogenase (NADP+)
LKFIFLLEKHFTNQDTQTMIQAKGYAAQSSTASLAPWAFERRAPDAHDVQLEILYCGVCHSDLHQIRNEWYPGIFPMVPGHEIVGKVTHVGSAVKKFKIGEHAGIGCLVDSCRTCENCKDGLEQHCQNGAVGTYNSRYKNGMPTYGGYSNNIVVHEDFALHVSDKLSLAAVAPLLCAGITTYSPLRHWKVGAGHRLGVVGLGGLGHMAVKFGVAFGAEVTVLSTSPSKEAAAKKLGAHKFILTSDSAQQRDARRYFDFIIDTVSAPHDVKPYLSMIRTNGTHIFVGIPPKPLEVPVFSLMNERRSIAASSIGGLPETQEMLDFCAENNITSDIELIKMSYIHEAYERMLKGDVLYRFVIDMSTL